MSDTWGLAKVVRKLEFKPLHINQLMGDSKPGVLCHTLCHPLTCLMNRDLALADWLEELAIYGTPRRFPDAETAYHLSQLIRHRYIVALALASR